MPTTLGLATFTIPHQHTASSAAILDDFSSWILPAAHGSIIDGEIYYGTRVEDENIVEIFFRA